MDNYSCFVRIVLLMAVLFSGCDVEDSLQVTSHTPSDGMDQVAVDTDVTVSFNRGVVKKELEQHFFMSCQSGSVDGRIQWVTATSFRFLPDEPLDPGTRYQVLIGVDVHDRSGGHMSEDYIFSFYTLGFQGAPVVVRSTPAMGTGNQLPTGLFKTAVLEFSQAMDTAVVEQSLSVSPSIPYYITWSNSGTGIVNARATLNFTSDMEYGKVYRLRLSTGACNSDGVPMERGFTLTWLSGEDTEPPEVASINNSIIPGALPWSWEQINHDVSTHAVIGIHFTKEMDQAVTQGAFYLSPHVEGHVEWNAPDFMVFYPDEELDHQSLYTVSVSTTAVDINGLRLSREVSLTFITDDPFSRYLEPAVVYGSPDGIHDTVLLSGYPGMETWPVIINMGGGENREYFFTITFQPQGETGGEVIMDRTSAYGNCTIQSFSTLDPALLSDLWWLDDRTLVIHLTGLSNRAIPEHPVTLYRLVIAGGSTGLKDTGGNTLEKDIVLEFREEER